MDRSKDIGPGEGLRRRDEPGESLRRREGESAADDVEGHGLVRKGGESAIYPKASGDESDVEGHAMRTRGGEPEGARRVREGEGVGKAPRLDDTEESDTEGHTSTRIR